MSIRPLPLASAVIFCLLAGGCERPKRSATKHAMMEELNPPAEVTRKVYSQWRDARRGTEAGEDLTNPYWVWLIREEVSSYLANEYFGGPSSFDGKPAWSANRFGQSETKLPDGRVLLIAGEHEDFYDPDFFIYNDIIEKRPDGTVRIIGFPEKVFPPTDFHSASWVEGEIILIGNLGYPEQRKPGVTQILVIDPATWEVRHQESTGESPGWIHEHEAVVEEGSIMVRKGEVVERENVMVENFDDWRLHLSDWRWERLTRRKATVLEFERKDGERSGLSDMWMWEINQQTGFSNKLDRSDYEGLDPEFIAELEESMKGLKPKDAEAYSSRYQPDGIEYRVMESEDDAESAFTVRIEVEGVVVRYKENMAGVVLTIEGELPAEVVERLSSDLKGKLERAEGVGYKVTKLR